MIRQFPHLVPPSNELDGGDGDEVVRIGADQRLGSIDVCLCSTLRYELGHIPSCPLSGYPPHVVAVDRAGASVRPFGRRARG